MKSRLELGIIETDNLTRKSAAMLINNVGKIIAAIAVTVATLAIFTDVGLSQLSLQTVTSNAIIVLMASYLIYFSLEDSGERLGEESEEYINASKKYEEQRTKLAGTDIEALRRFCLEYSMADLEYRRSAYLASYALSDKDYESFLEGKDFPHRERRILRKASRMKTARIDPKDLITKEKINRKSELNNPEKTKPWRLIMKLIPSTVCMCLTFSVIFTVKNDLSASKIIEGIVKLSTLPIVGFRAYANGYNYIQKVYIPWIETKERLISEFIKKRTDSVLTLNT